MAECYAQTRLATGTPRIEAIELIAGDVGVVLGLRTDDLREIADVTLPGRLFNVFEIRDGRIATVRDFVRRGDALTAAGAREPAGRSDAVPASADRRPGGVPPRNAPAVATARR